MPGADPAAADHAWIGRVPLPELTRAALLSDGAARAVDLFHITDWAGVVALLSESGPLELIARVRAAEAGDETTARWPPNKVSDDATAVYCDQFHELKCKSH